MHTRIFKSKDYKWSLLSVTICIIIPLMMTIIGKYSNNFILMACIYSIMIFMVNIMNGLSLRLAVNDDGLVIKQLFRKQVAIAWDTIDSIQSFTNYNRQLDYITLKQAVNLPYLPYNQNLPKEFRKQAIVLNAWEKHQEIIDLIRAKVPKKPEQQLFVPIVGRSWDKILPYAIFIMGLGAAVLAWSLYS